MKSKNGKNQTEKSSDRANFVLCSCIITLLGKESHHDNIKGQGGFITILRLPGQPDSRKFRRCIVARGTLPTLPMIQDYIDPHSLLKR